MAKVLTTGSSVKCPHGFAVRFTSTATLHVGGKPVVRASDVAGAVIPCTSNPKCMSIASPSTSTVLHDAGSPVVVDTSIRTNMLSSGGTASIGTCTVDANHDLLHTE
jgi:hypothetical protein